MAPVIGSFLSSIFSTPAAGNYAQASYINSYIKTSQSLQDATYTKISSLGKLLNSLEKLRDSLKDIKIDSLRIMTDKVSDDGVLSATSYSTANEGVYGVKVSNIAQSQTLNSKVYPGENSDVGTGTLTIKIADNIGVDIDITESRKTLSRLRDVLNASDAGINASLLKETGGYRLTISAKDSGEANNIGIIISDDDLNNTDSNGLSALAYDKNGVRNMTESLKPNDAAFFVDSNFFNRASNKVTDAITGVTMTLSKENGGYPVTVTVSKDSGSFIFGKLDSFVAAYNNVIKLADELYAQTGARPGVLKDNPSVGYLRNTLADIETKTYSNSSLKSLGFSFNTQGIMSLDIGKMDSAMSSDLKNVTAVMNSLASDLETTVNSFIDTVIPAQQKDYRTFVDTYIKSEKQVLAAYRTSSLNA